MTLRLRRLLYAACIIIFFIVAPPLVLYTAGWRYDFTYHRVVETGSLVIKSTPAGATIRLNDQPYSDVTPAIINNILPGKINLEVAKDGYYPWQRALAIAPRVTTFVENIKLFLKGSPQAFLPSAVRQYWWNRDQDKIAYLTPDGEFRLFNTLNKKDSRLANSIGTLPALVSWSPHDDQLLVNRQVIDVNFPEKIISLDAVFGQKYNNLQWDPIVPDTLYGLAHGALYHLPYRLATARLVAAGPISDYELTATRTAWVEKNPVSLAASLTWINPAEPDALRRLPLRADAANGLFIRTNSRSIALYSAAKKILLVADPEIVENTATTTGAILEIPNVAKAIWTHDGSRLLYTDGSAIYQRAFPDPTPTITDERATTLITRYSEPIADMFWSDDELYLFYIIGSRLNVLETIPNFTPFSLELLNTGQILKQPEFVRNQLMVTYIDGQGALQSLPIGQKQSGSFFFGN